DRGRRPANRLLSGDDIAEARAWAARRPKSAPEPTALHLDCIRASEEETEARLSAQRKQLEVVAAAQAERETALHKAEEALKKAADAQRRRGIIIYFAFVVVSIVAVLGGFLYFKEKQEKEQVLAVIESDALSTSRLAEIYHRGQFGHGAPDYTKARERYEKAADIGAAYAMDNLGALYEDGEGVAQDYAKARELFEMAADKGNTSAMTNLGWLYRNGQSVPQDYAKARELFEMAADKGDFAAMNSLALLYRNGQAVPQDYAKARELFEKAAAKGNTSARNNLGKPYPADEAAPDNPP